VDLVSLTLHHFGKLGRTLLGTCRIVTKLAAGSHPHIANVLPVFVASQPTERLRWTPEAVTSGTEGDTMTNDDALRAQLRSLLDGREAHVDFKRAVADMPEIRRGEKPDDLPYSPWQQVEHMRITQWDILEYIRNPRHVSPPWPHGYWPENAAPAADAWERSVRSFERDREALRRLVADPSTSLFTQIPHGEPGHTILREVLLVADHTAYHLGQLIVLRRLLGSWTK
jgi:hypothetical protein